MYFLYLPLLLLAAFLVPDLFAFTHARSQRGCCHSAGTEFQIPLSLISFLQQVLFQALRESRSKPMQCFLRLASVGVFSCTETSYGSQTHGKLNKLPSYSVSNRCIVPGAFVHLGSFCRKIKCHLSSHFLRGRLIA